MNKNWDEIRGKAEPEQNVPTKTFTHQGTQYALTGDLDRAYSHFHEARAHLGKMKRMNVNELPIISGQQSFDDGSIATYKLVHGKEDIHITSPMAQLEVKPTKEEKGSTEEIEQIVPVIRSIDNTHWIACMSGTFEGPYLHFPNIFEIPVEAFDDNIETDLDGQLISIGDNEYDGSINAPELYFIAQTGVRPEEDDLDWTDGESSGEAGTLTWSATPEIAKCYDLYGNWIMDAMAVGAYSPTPGVTYSSRLTLWGGDYAPYYTEFSSSSGGKVADNVPHYAIHSDAVFASDPSPPSDEEMRLQVKEKFDSWYAIEASLNPPFKDWNVRYYENTSSHIQSEQSLFDAENSIRAERGGSSKSCSGYSIHEQSSTTTRTQNYPYPSTTQTSNGWVYGGDAIYTTTETESFSDYFQVDDRKYLLAEHSGYYPAYVPAYFNKMKYYNTDSIAAITGMMSAGIREDGGTYSWFKYYYVGPNNHNEITETVFGTDNGAWRHIIPNVEGIDDTVMFEGEIFLGLVKYEIEA
jgi:hypothetical protein